MHEARFRADDLGQMGQEGDDVVLGLALDLVDAGDVEGRVLGLGPDRLGGVLRDDAEFRQRVRRMRLDLEPDLEARLRLPDRGHFGTGIAGDHRRAPKHGSRVRQKQLPRRVFEEALADRPLLRQGEGLAGRVRKPLEMGQPAGGGEAHELGVGLQPGLGLDQIVVILDRLHAEIEVGRDLFGGQPGRELSEDLDLPFAQPVQRGLQRIEALGRERCGPRRRSWRARRAPPRGWRGSMPRARCSW